MHHFCTYFDSQYLACGLALHQSLKRHCPAFKLWVLCLDDETYAFLSRLNLPEVQLLTVERLERDDPSLIEAKTDRSRLEFYFTSTAPLLLSILKNNPQVERITYLDADLFFFSDPAPLFGEMGDHSIAIIAHRFAAPLRHFERYGIFNVGWVSFKRDDRGLKCLRWWRERCLEWCCYRVEGERFGDQKYLDDWPKRFRGVIVLEHKGANLAPWNVANYRLSVRRHKVFVDDQPLIFFHFHGLKQLTGWLYDIQLERYLVKPSKIVIKEIYAPYLRMISTITSRLGVSELVPLVALRRENGGAREKRGSLVRRSARACKDTVQHCARLARRQNLMVVKGRVI